MKGRVFRFFAFCILVIASPRGESLELHGRSTAVVKNAALTLLDAAEVAHRQRYPRLSTDQVITNIHYPTLITSSELRRLIDEILDESFIFVGGSIKCIPDKYIRSGGTKFLLSLLAFLDRELAGYGWIEIMPDSGRAGIQGDTFPHLLNEHEAEFVLLPVKEAGDYFRVLFRRRADSTYTRISALIKAQGLPRTAPVLVREARTVDTEGGDEDTGKLLKSGSHVSVYIGTGAIQVTLKGTTLGSGAADDTIRVRIEETGKELYAVVLGPSEVQVVY